MGRPKIIMYEQYQINLKMPLDLYREIKQHALDYNMTIKKWIEIACLERIVRENKAQK